jgi:hypothetical protein
MYQHFNSRRKMVQRILTYCLMTLAVIVGVAGTTAWILGYRPSFQNEQLVERISLLQFGSFPSNADIFVNDQKLNFTTPGRYDSVTSGVNYLKYQLEGYHNWQATVELKPAEVRWVNYARLVPNEIVSQPAVEVVSYYQAMTAPNGNFILLHEVAETPKFKILDISDPKNIKTTEIEIPSQLLVGVVKNIDIIEWDSNSNYVLLNQDGNILWLNRRDIASSLNLTTLFGVGIDDPHFLNDDSNIVFGLTETNLRRFDIKSKTTSAPLVGNVQSYEAYGDGKLSYVSQLDNQQIIGVYFKDKNYVLENFDNAQATYTSFSHYYREDFFLSTRAGKVDIIKNPFSESSRETTTIDLPFEANGLFHSGGGRMVVAIGQSQIFVYDLETATSYHFDTEGFDKKPFWLDDFHLGYLREGELKMIEFSGENRESLVPATEFGVFSSNNEHLFTFNSTAEGTFLVDSSMLAPKS